MDMMTDNFGIEIRNGNIMFKYNKSTYKISSKIYPLNGRKFDMFTSKNTVDVKDEKIKELFNICKFQIGKCYINAEIMKQISEKNNLEEVQYYAGWVFMGAKPPMNHAWIVYEHNSVIDSSILQNINCMFNELNKNTATKTDYARILKREIDSNKSNCDKFTFGQVIEPLIYVGCEDTYSHARELFKKALDITKDKHPSYVVNSGLNPYGNSELQNIMKII